MSPLIRTCVIFPLLRKHFTEYFLPDYYHCGKSVCYAFDDQTKFKDRCLSKNEVCPYPKCCGCRENCLDKAFCEAFEIKIQTEDGVYSPTVTKVGFRMRFS